MDPREAHQSRDTIGDPRNPSMNAVARAEHRRQGDGPHSMAGRKAGTLTHEAAAHSEPRASKIAGLQDVAGTKPAGGVLRHFSDDLGIEERFTREPGTVHGVRIVAYPAGQEDHDRQQALAESGLEP